MHDLNFPRHERGKSVPGSKFTAGSELNKTSITAQCEVDDLPTIRRRFPEIERWLPVVDLKIRTAAAHRHIDLAIAPKRIIPGGVPRGPHQERWQPSPSRRSLVIETGGDWKTRRHTIQLLLLFRSRAKRLGPHHSVQDSLTGAFLLKSNHGGGGTIQSCETAKYRRLDFHHNRAFGN